MIIDIWQNSKEKKKSYHWGTFDAHNGYMKAVSFARYLLKNVKSEYIKEFIVFVYDGYDGNDFNRYNLDEYVKKFTDEEQEGMEIR